MYIVLLVSTLVAACSGQGIPFPYQGYNLAYPPYYYQQFPAFAPAPPIPQQAAPVIESVPLQSDPRCQGLYEGYLAGADQHSFIQCSNGLASEQICPGGTVWDQNQQRCENAYAPPPPPAVPAVPTYVAPTYRAPVEVPTYVEPVVPAYTEPPAPTYAPEPAPAVPSYNGGQGLCTNLYEGLEANPDDCTSFVLCSNGKATVMTCPGGTKWSQTYLRCLQPEYADCGNLQHKPTSFLPGYPGPVPDNACAGRGDGNYPDPANCGAFIKCSNYVARRLECGEGTYWSQTQQQCVHPAESDCGGYRGY